MNDLLKFLTSSEAIIVYIVAALSCCLCFIIYLVERNNVKLRQKHNTRELNKLVSQVKEEANIEEPVMYDVPIMQPIEESSDTKLSEMLAETQVLKVIRDPEVLEVKEEVVTPSVEKIEMESVDILKEAEEAQEDDLVYTSIEPDMQTAQLELQKLTEELKKQEELEKQVSVEDTITNYEAQQEENAIISLDELVHKSKEMYEANELTQYADEGNEPISLDELANRYGKEAATFVEPFEIQKVVPEKEVLEELEEATVQPVEEEKKFKSSPIISPIYGIEKPSDQNRDIELENTANYEKLDAEIQKTNEFLMTLKDLQQKVD